MACNDLNEDLVSVFVEVLKQAGRKQYSTSLFVSAERTHPIFYFSPDSGVGILFSGGLDSIVLARLFVPADEPSSSEVIHVRAFGKEGHTIRSPEIGVSRKTTSERQRSRHYYNGSREPCADIETQE